MNFIQAVLFLTLLFPPGRSPASVQDLLRLSEDKIDVGIAALALAKEIYPDIDIAAYSARIDALADRVRRLAKRTQDPDQRIRCLNTVLFLHEKFEADRAASIQRKPENYYLNRLLDSKRGNCFSMPLLYVAVAQRLGWPVYLVHVPDHAFVRYVDPAFEEQNIEATSGGGYVPDEKYAKDFLVSAAGRKSGAYLRALTHRELLGDLAAVNGIRLGRQGYPEKTVAYLTVAARLNPRNAAVWNSLNIAHKMVAKRSSGPEAKRNLDLAAKYSRKRDQLGFVNPQDVPQFASTGRPQ